VSISGNRQEALEAKNGGQEFSLVDGSWFCIVRSKYASGWDREHDRQLCSRAVVAGMHYCTPPFHRRVCNQCCQEFSLIDGSWFCIVGGKEASGWD
jgi:hypothetical protein